MSVINRMLRDLDQRQQQHSKGAAYTPAASAPQPLHWSWMIGIAVGTAVLLIVIFNLYWWLTQAEPSEARVTEPHAAEVTAVASSEPEQKQEAEPQLPAESQPESQPEPAAPQLQRGPVKPRELVEVPTDTVTAETVANDSPSNELNDSPAPELAADQSVTEASAAEQAATESPSSFAVDRVQLSPNELAESNLQKARNALRRGEREQGQELLEKALTVMPEHVAVRSELAAYWYGRGFATRAVAILQQGMDLVPQQSQWQLLLGRILERMGRIEDAYVALQSLDTSTSEYPGLLEVRANAANQLGYFSEAAQDFLALANLQGEGRWWLAAAVAFEDAGEPTAAVRAYQQAAFARDLGGDARRYAEDRLQALGGS